MADCSECKNARWFKSGTWEYEEWESECDEPEAEDFFEDYGKKTVILKDENGEYEEDIYCPVFESFLDDPDWNKRAEEATPLDFDTFKLKKEYNK